MVTSLSKISHPYLRALTGGLAVSGGITMISALILGFTAPKNENLHKLAVYATGIGGIGGAIAGLATKGQPKTRKQPSPPSSGDWQDWQSFVVTRKVPESNEITSFYLQPQNPIMLPDYQPGQFLTIKLNIPNQSRPVIRTYSLSDYNQNHTYYRLSIKREPAPRDLDVPPGIASNFMHDQVKEGDIIQCKPPNGKFFLNLDRPNPVVLVSNGVGITPMIAMAKALARTNSPRTAWFVHGARSGDYHAFASEVSAVAQQYPNLQVHYCYSRPEAADQGKYHSQGYVDVPLLKQLVGSNLAQAEIFICGSPAFMDSLIQNLKTEGIPASKIFFEAFGGGKPKGVAKVAESEEKTAEIVFTQSEQTLTWTSQDGSILEFAEANNLNPAYSCRVGVCLTCMCRIVEGEVEYPEEPSGTPDPGHVLICVSKPKTPRVVLEV